MGMIFAIILAVAVPVSLLIWIINVYIYIFMTHSSNDTSTGTDGVWVPISPYRWMLALVLPGAIARWGLYRKSLDRTGAVAGMVVGMTMTLGGYNFLGALLTFFVLGSKITKFRRHQKLKLEHDYKEGGQRTWIQVVCNGGVAAQLAVLYLLEVGCRELPTDFENHYSASWLGMAILGALACSSGDTFSSEVGSVVGTADPLLITSFQRVPRGTNGGVSAAGLGAGVLGGLLVGVGYYLGLLMGVDTHVLHMAPPQWPVIIVAATAGLHGSLIDSLLGATLQFSGLDEERKCVVETPGVGVRPICGTPFLDNHSVNLLAGLGTALLTPTVALTVWAYVT